MKAREKNEMTILTKEVHCNDAPVALSVVLDLIGPVEIGNAWLAGLKAGRWGMMIHA
jgi:hypothetical protein